MAINLKELSSLMNENKLRVLLAIYRCKSDVCACTIIDDLNMPKNLLSYHIKTLRELEIIEEVKCGRFKNYSIKKEKFKAIKRLLEITEMI